MKLPRVILTLVMLFILTLLPCLQVSAAAPAEPVTRYLFKTAGLELPNPFEISTIYASATPGGATAVHHHPGLLLGTILAGELTFVDNKTSKVTKYSTGGTYIELPGAVGLARNEAADTNFVWVSVILPKGVPYSAPETGEATPKNPYQILFQNRVDGKVITGDYEFVTFVNEFAPGAQTPVQTYGGQLVTTPLDGDLSFVVNGVEKVYKAGQTFEQIPGEYGQARNLGSTNNRVLMSALLPKGKPLATLKAAEVPASGAGGNSSSEENWLLYLMVGFGVIATGGFVLLLIRSKKKNDVYNIFKQK